MKRLIFIFLSIFTLIPSAYTQTPNTEVVTDYELAQDMLDTFVYGEIIGVTDSVSSELSITYDFGNSKMFWDCKKYMDGLKSKQRGAINSMVDAMNFMGVDGWELVQTYVVTNNNVNTYHWVIQKSVYTFDERDVIFNNFNKIKDCNKNGNTNF